MRPKIKKHGVRVFTTRLTTTTESTKYYKKLEHFLQVSGSNLLSINLLTSEK